MKMININGQDVINLLPENARQGALVDMKTLKRLSDLLPLVSVYEGKNHIIAQISSCSTLEEVCNVMSDELAFHTTVNLINEVKVEDLIGKEERVEQW